MNGGCVLGSSRCCCARVIALYFRFTGVCSVYTWMYVYCIKREDGIEISGH